MKAIKKLSFLTLAVFAVAGFAMPAHADTITVDQILYKLNQPPTYTGGIDLSQAGNLHAAVDMIFAPVNNTHGLLTVLLTNTSTKTTGDTRNASNLLTSIGFNLPDGVKVIDTPPTYDSAIIDPSVLPGYGSTIVNGTFSQDNWGWGTKIGGHYDDPGVYSVNLTLGTIPADVDRVFGGTGGLGGVDYGLISSNGSPGPLNTARYVPSIKFSIFLEYTSPPSNLLQYIEYNNVVVGYGSPAALQGQININPPVPEPAAMFLFGSGLIGAAAVIRRRFRKQS